MDAAAGSINWMAAVIAAVAAFVIGGLWYSPLMFYKPWLRATKLDEAELARGNPAIIYGVGFVFALTSSLVFALFLGPSPALAFALGAGASAGACWVATSFGINYLFERKPLALLLINGGYHTVQFTAYGAILGLWH